MKRLGDKLNSRNITLDTMLDDQCQELFKVTSPADEFVRNNLYDLLKQILSQLIQELELE